ncbi:hypothetical protein FGG08_004053 [Glutinoglossum americanum]|uniref:Cysteine-rich transmembrane CYSTM domain-containing protein n=1 Tax=Glutinoglossum americanum TaxID=1670608 RepID=A0A9P8I609_9PEZI|nr:hypothetical protein FGG08_004053 [Glutinoglossum americanum]
MAAIDKYHSQAPPPQYPDAVYTQQQRDGPAGPPLPYQQGPYPPPAEYYGQQPYQYGPPPPQGYYGYGPPPPQGMYYQQGPPPNTQGYFADGRGGGSGGSGGLCAAVLAALACCCCLDFMF